MHARTTRRRVLGARAAGPPAARKHSLPVLARAGFAARGVMYILIGWIALQIAFGQTTREADSRGAVLVVRSTPVGAVVLWALAIGFACLALWRLAQALTGQQDPEERKVSARLLALAMTVIYGFMAYGIFRYAAYSAAPKSSNAQSVDGTAKLMRLPGGQALVVIVGIGLIAIGVYLIWATWCKKFLRVLETDRMTAGQRRLTAWLGEVGGISRSVVFGALGVFIAVAGAQHDARQAKGLDSTLRSFAHTALGPWLLVMVAVGMALFGVYSCFEARWRRVS